MDIKKIKAFKLNSMVNPYNKKTQKKLWEEAEANIKQTKIEMIDYREELDIWTLKNKLRV